MKKLMNSEEIRAQILATGAQLALLGNGTTDTAEVARQMGLSTKVVGAHVGLMIRKDWLEYVHDAGYPPQRWKFSVLGAILATTHETIS